MKNKLLAQGKMFCLQTKVITKVKLKELMKKDRSGDLYERNNKRWKNENDLYGFYQIDKSSFEIELNEALIGFKKAVLVN